MCTMSYERTSNGIHFYGDPLDPLRNGQPQSPVNIMFLTSVRDTGGDDRNGLCLDLTDGQHYMEGVIERTTRETRDGLLAGIVRVVGVITDDRERDMERVRRKKEVDYPVRPTHGRNWIHPLDLRNDRDELLISSDVTHWVPSEFRRLPLDALDERARAKEDFEDQVMTLMHQRGANLLISDHYMARLVYLIRNGLFGRVLNIHPAVTVEGHPCAFPGQSPTNDSIARAQHGHTTTGATLHFVDEFFDHGQPISFSADTPVHASDREDPMRLRYRNYQQAKLPVFVEGLCHYAQSLLPRLGLLLPRIKDRTLSSSDSHVPV